MPLAQMIPIIISLCALAMTIVTFVVGHKASLKAATKLELHEAIERFEACERELSARIAQIERYEVQFNDLLRQNRELTRENYETMRELSKLKHGES